MNEANKEYSIGNSNNIIFLDNSSCRIIQAIVILELMSGALHVNLCGSMWI